MTTNLIPLIVAVAALFGTFMSVLAYTLWTTRGIEVYRAEH